jgi:hypothetical protein
MLGNRLLLDGNLDAILLQLQADTGIDIHVDISHPDQGKAADKVTAPVLIKKFKARNEQEEDGDVVAEAIFAGEQIKELAFEKLVTVLTAIRTVFARLPKDFFMCDRPCNGGDW